MSAEWDSCVRGEKRLLTLSCTVVLLTTASLFIYIPELAAVLLGNGSVVLLPPHTPAHMRQQFYALAMSLPQVCSAVGAPVMGALSDRFGRRPILLLAVAGVAAAMLLCAGSVSHGHPLLLLLGLAAVGLMDGSGVVVQAGLIEAQPPEKQASHINRLAAFSILGIIAGPCAGGLFADRRIFPFVPGAAVPFLITAALFVLTFAMVAAFYKVPGRSRTLDVEEPAHWAATLSGVLRPPQVRRHLLVFFLMEVELACFYERIPMILTSLHASSSTIGFYGAYMGAIMVLVCGLVVPSFPSSWHSDTLLVSGFAAILVGGLLLGGQPGSARVWMAALPFATGAATIYCSAMARMTESAAAHDQGKIAGLAAWVSGCAFLFAGLAISSGPSSSPFRFPLLLGAVALLGILCLSQSREIPRAQCATPLFSSSSNDGDH